MYSFRRALGKSEMGFLNMNVQKNHEDSLFMGCAVGLLVEQVSRVQGWVQPPDPGVSGLHCVSGLHSGEHYPTSICVFST